MKGFELKVELWLKDIDGELVIENVYELGYYFDDADQEMKVFMN